jgi:2-dehydropantoate 2-reductase
LIEEVAKPMPTKKIAVLGTGANGASIAADIAEAGHDVVLIDQWPAHVEAMRRQGLRIEMPDKMLQVSVRAFHLCEVCTFKEQFDVVLLAVKTYDTRWSCELIKPYLKASGLIAGLQNGMTTDAIADVMGPERTIGCVIEIASTMFDPGVISRHTPRARSWFALGAINKAADGRESEIAALLEHSGSVDVVSNIRASKWMKLVSNATVLGPTALLGLPIKEAVELPGMRDLMLRAGQEAIEVGEDLGFAALPILGLTAVEMRESNRVVETLLDKLLSNFISPATKTTVLQDWMKGRRSEVDDINGLVGSQTTRSAPVNRAVTALAHLVERGELKPEPSNRILLQKTAEEFAKCRSDLMRDVIRCFSSFLPRQQ